ncbi:BTAD domain-containing putative transcriptional regulator [Streptomyces europaeiscabiei]|uniref:AfsR/SARP family transcriptional regulator n=2 Tax=Streptomyces europaeiscabiei TaxID=146819 RepID=UPI0029AD7DB9|nr:BTAD domain-containing putative transcriptional regulator [Streptomyces europaeiscabiei]MDX3628992.1 BTAD domain-containing putative transcriptional regulator [Streptomyces europaeiscabiei]MDX3647390.1 BTAD domain-containing putative transcriptional regulator [Streptomyces europaeiscabiei]
MALEPVWFAVLGPVRVERAGVEPTWGRPQERALLALLSARAGQPVAVSEIVDVLWGRLPPDSAVNVIRRHVGSLRRLLEPGLPNRAAGRWLIRDAGGYRLVVDAGSLDLLRFRRLRDEARRVGADGHRASARVVELLTEALSLWRGPVGAGLPAEVRERAGFGAVDRERPAAVREAADAALRAGTPAAVLHLLQEAAVADPLDEPLLARLVLTLAATGREAEALSIYRAARARLSDELGIDPGPELRDAHAAVVRGAGPTTPTASGAEAANGPAVPPAPRPPTTVPAQLPHDLPTFTGRRAELEQLLALLTGHSHVHHSGDRGAGDHAPPAGTVVISAIGGMAGIGKTTLAVHWAHRVADRFPDGQLYVNLRGFAPSGAVMGAGEAVRVFLDALGVPPERVPHGVDAQAALYRSLLAGRRFLVLLDNARDTEQVRPLLPGTPGCLTIVTSRNQLSGLVSAHGAHTLPLRPLDAEQARMFLERRLGAGRLTGEARAVAEIAALCGGLPLALACVAARAAAHPGFSLSAIAAELREAHGSLDAFSRTDASANVGAVFSWSLGAVSAEAARLFPLLALHPGPDFSVSATATLAELPLRRARSLLAELADVHLVGEPALGRYALHDLLRAHAAELLEERLPDAGREAATERLYAYYLHTAHATEPLLAPHADPMPPGPLPAGVHAEPLVGHEQALAWLAAEHPVLLAVVGAAARSGRDRTACLLAWSLESFFDRRGHWHDWATVQRIALDAALRLSDPAWEARGLRALARAEGRLGLHASARPRLDRALRLFAGLGDDIGRADTHRSLGWTHEQEGDLPGALHHNRLAMELFRHSGRRAAYASVLNSVGWYHALLDEHREALSHCHEALTLLQELGDRYGQASTWHTIAYAHHHLGHHPNALVGYGHALALYRELGVPYLEACTLVHIGDTHTAMGDHDTAHEVRQQALTLLITLGHPDADEVRAQIAASERCG